jgi:hypothetical protein
MRVAWTRSVTMVILDRLVYHEMRAGGAAALDIGWRSEVTAQCSRNDAEPAFGMAKGGNRW